MTLPTSAPAIVPMPIRTPRLLIRPKTYGDSAETVVAVRETWNELHRWMQWAENLDEVNVEQQCLRFQIVDIKFALREEFNLIGIEVAKDKPVVWCGLHDIDWSARHCEAGFWVRKSAHNCGFATECTNALLRYAFRALEMKKVGISHSAGNFASQRVIQKLGFVFEGVEPLGNVLPEGRRADKFCYSRYDADDLPELEVHW